MPPLIPTSEEFCSCASWTYEVYEFPLFDLGDMKLASSQLTGNMGAISLALDDHSLLIRVGKQAFKKWK